MSGSKFFTSEVLNDRMKIARTKSFRPYRIAYGASIEDTELVDADEDFATLKVWEQPVDGAYYVIGADPAYGSSSWKDQFCIQVTRCYADAIEQVAEFCTIECDTTRFAWVMICLSAWYNSGGSNPKVMMNLEINGPGQNVWSEIQNLRRLTPLIPGLDPRIVQMCANIQNYLYKRPDSMGGGYAYHWKTDGNSKERMLNAFKDGFERSIITLNSEDCLSEMKKVVREDGDIAAPGRSKDDRVIAMALCTVAWHDFIQLRLASIGHTRAKRDQPKDLGPGTPLARNVSGWLSMMGIKRDGQNPLH